MRKPRKFPQNEETSEVSAKPVNITSQTEDNRRITESLLTYVCDTWEKHGELDGTRKGDNWLC